MGIPAVIIGDVTIGPRSSVWPYVTIRADEVGKMARIPISKMARRSYDRHVTTIGDRVSGHNCILHGCIIESDAGRHGQHRPRQCAVGRGAFMGERPYGT